MKNSINANEISVETGKGGNKTMKNTIKERRAAEAAAAAEAKKAADKDARLAAIEPVDIVGTMSEVTTGIAHTVRDEEGCAIGTNGGKLYQTPVTAADGSMTTIAADSAEALEELKKNIEAGLSGDGKFHKLVYIGGMACDCAGATLEELEADIAAAEDYAKAHSKGSVLRDIDVAEQLVDADYKKEDLEQVDGSDGGRYLICYDGNYIMTLEGDTIADLSDLKSKLGREDVKTLLIERLNKWIEENSSYDDEDDDDWYDDDDDYEDEDEESDSDEVDW